MADSTALSTSASEGRTERATIMIQLQQPRSGGPPAAKGNGHFSRDKFGPRRVPAAPSDFAAAPRAAAAAVAATTPTARPVDASRAASSGSAPGGRSGACGPSSVATAFGADGRRPLSRAAFPSGGCAACPAAAFLGHPQGV
ncbi:uncharacterized protein LOC126482164 [Schistocerca serialis cubense]|uniref:uncharacterized protein LOC126482164 n=1 Tax=Schistocerca serialis cubense TaxID=2023355 RepID=UPI00214F01A1|nr:uncharacterized protein LOC126482164 [Schistocerca serialis cubense]